MADDDDAAARTLLGQLPRIFRNELSGLDPVDNLRVAEEDLVHDDMDVAADRLAALGRHPEQLRPIVVLQLRQRALERFGRFGEIARYSTLRGLTLKFDWRGTQH